ncbi:hypothetical protein OS493_024436 [Desmophyllum pertusum]|uniref:Uncharacterized protein n=1 Tax=Desmophyllum pertusum TaxID=174260 RepID=A0A9X0CDW1_9CNID|nr:hypothetical protein OS493_024436 [Desmophyllum pertusum]
MQNMCSGEDLSNKEGLSSAQKRPRDLVQDTQENVLNKEGSLYPGQKRLKVSPSEPDKENGRDKEFGLTSKVKTGSPSLKELRELAYDIGPKNTEREFKTSTFKQKDFSGEGSKKYTVNRTPNMELVKKQTPKETIDTHK